LVGWLAGRSPELEPAPETDTPLVVVTNFGPTPEHPLIMLPDMATPPTEAADPGGYPAGLAPDVSNTAWEQDLEQIVLGDFDGGNKVGRLSELMKTAPEWGRAEIAQYLAGATPSDQFGPASEVLTNSQQPEAVFRAMWPDLLNRPDPVKLPLLLDIAQNDQHPMQHQAQDMLSYVFSSETATNAGQWQVAVQARLGALAGAAGPSENP